MSESFAIEVLLGSMVSQIDDLIRTDFGFARIRLTYPSPGDQRSYARWCGCRPQFGADANVFTIPLKVMTQPLPLANSCTRRTAERACLDELDRIRRHQTGDICWLVRDALRRSEQPVPKLKSVAERLGTSERSLRRRLQGANVSFRSLVTEFQRQTAIECLLDGDLSIREIADACGFSNAGAFGDAFKRWTGATPGAYRNAMADHARNRGLERNRQPNASGPRN